MAKVPTREGGGGWKRLDPNGPVLAKSGAEMWDFVVVADGAVVAVTQDREAAWSAAESHGVNRVYRRTCMGWVPGNRQGSPRTPRIPQ